MTVHPTCSFKRFCLPHWVSNIAKIYINILFCFVSWALWRTVWAASVSGLFGSVCTMTVWHLNKFCKCKHTEQLLYTKPCCLVLKLSPAQQQAPAMATYGGVSINKHLGLSPVTRTLQLTHKHMLRHTVTAASSGRGFTDTIWEYRKSLGFSFAAAERALLWLYLNFVLGIWLLSILSSVDLKDSQTGPSPTDNCLLL